MARMYSSPIDKILLQVNVNTITSTDWSSSNNTTGRLHVLRCLPELLLVAVAVAVAYWGPVKEVHDSPHRVSTSGHSQEHPLQHYAVDLSMRHTGYSDKNQPVTPVDPAQMER
jgi:hypothetical protein